MSDSRSWKYPLALSKQEELICSRLKSNGKLFVFLRKYRHQIFTEELNQKLISMYSEHPKGKPVVPASQLAMATLLQCYEQKSDSSAVLEALFDKRWQMVLDCLGCEKPPFSQGTLCDFRHRLVKHNLDEELLSRTVEVAKELGGFCYKQLRVALDSAPLQGAGRVEDTFNLIGHALELLVNCAAEIKCTSEEKIIEESGTQLIGNSSIKAALDIDWSIPSEKQRALKILLNDVALIHKWLSTQPKYVTKHKELKEALSLLEHVITQNIDPDPDGEGPKMKEGVSKDRLISLVDQDMRHGRKSKSKTINGYKQHIAIDLDHKLILATSLRPANEPEHKASKKLKPKVEKFGEVISLSIDKGYLAADWTVQLYEAGKKVIAKPWSPPSNGKYSKKDFQINLEENKVTCPANQTVPIKGKPNKLRARFSNKLCDKCELKKNCSESKSGRVISLHANEVMLQDLKYFSENKDGRAQARERVKVEHSLASICNRKGHRARYIGVRLNEYDLNRTAMISNLHVAMNLAA